MSTDSGLARLLRPTSVAIVGLSADPSKHGARVLANLRRFGFEGAVWGVNPATPAVEGVDMFASLADGPGTPDVVVLAIPTPAVPETIKIAGDVGAGAAILFGGGFAEAGSDGATRQRHILELARRSRVRLLGPNSAGVINATASTVMSFLTCLERPAEQIRPGPVGLVTQSGGTGSFIHNLAAERGSGLAVSISTGNEADVQVGEALAQLVHDPGVDCVALLLETIRDGPRFIEAAEAALDAGKPIVACKIGQSDAGQAIMRTHTGALAGAARRYDAVFDALGIVTTDTPEQLFDVAELLARVPTPPGDRIGVVTHSGGTAVLLADKTSASGLTLPQPSDVLRERLASFLQHGAAGNPADLGGIITAPERYAQAVRAFAEDASYDIVVPVSTPHPSAHSASRAQALVELSRSRPEPLPNLWLAGDLGAEGLQILRAAGVPATTSTASLVAGLRGMVRLANVRRDTRFERSTDPHPSVRGRFDTFRRYGEPVTLSEPEGKALVDTMGLPVARGKVVATPTEAVAAAELIGYPVVLKVVSTDLTHKTQAGGVEVGLRDGEQVTQAWRAIEQRVSEHAAGSRVAGFLVEEHVPGVEMLLGLARDPAFGLMVAVGTGGALAEAIDDMAVAFPPLTRAEAIKVIHSLRGKAVLHGFRGSDPTDVEGLVDLLVTLSRVAVDYADAIDELDLNPVTFSGGRWRAADALVRLRPA